LAFDCPIANAGGGFELFAIQDVYGADDCQRDLPVYGC
jgi:hypothetical protein